MWACFRTCVYINVTAAAYPEVLRPKPLFSIGLFADAQYADRPDYERPTEPGYGLADIARHVIGCHSTQDRAFKMRRMSEGQHLAGCTPGRTKYFRASPQRLREALVRPGKY